MGVVAQTQLAVSLPLLNGASSTMHGWGFFWGCLPIRKAFRAVTPKATSTLLLIFCC